MAGGGRRWRRPGAGRLTLMVQRDGADYTAWVGAWQVMVGYRDRAMDGMVMVDVGELTLPVAAGPVRGPRWSRAGKPGNRRVPANRIVGQEALANLSVPTLSTNRSEGPACSVVINVYARTRLALELVPESPVVEAGKEASFELTGPVGVGTFTVDATVGRIIGPVVDLVARLREVNLDQLGRRVRLPARLRDGKFDHGRVLAELEAQDPSSAQCATSRPGWCSTTAGRRMCTSATPRSPAATTSACTSPGGTSPTAPSCPATAPPSGDGPRPRQRHRRAVHPDPHRVARGGRAAPIAAGCVSCGCPRARRGGRSAGWEQPHVPLRQERLPLLLAGGERPRVAHHHLEQHDALGTGDEGPEVVAVVEGDVGAGPTRDVAAGHRALEHEHDVVAVVAVGLHHHPGVPAGVERQEPAADVEPPLVDRRRAGRIGPVLLPADLLPRQVVDVDDAWAARRG